MTDRGPKKPMGSGGVAPDGDTTDRHRQQADSTDRHRQQGGGEPGAGAETTGRLAVSSDAGSTLVDEEEQDGPTKGFEPLPPKPAAPAPRPQEPRRPEKSAGKGSSLSKMQAAGSAPARPEGTPAPARGPLSKEGLPAVRGPRSRDDMPAVKRTMSSDKLPVPRLSRPGLPQVKGPPRTKSSTAQAAVDPTRELTAESPTQLRPALPADDQATSARPALHELGTQKVPPSERPKGLPPIEPPAPPNTLEPAEPLQDNPAASTMGYRSLQPRQKWPFDRKTTVLLSGAVAGTLLLVGLLLGGRSSPPPPERPPPPIPLPRAVAEAARAAPPPERAEPTPAPQRPQAVFIEEQVDAGAGYVKTVKIEAGTIQIISELEVTLARNGVELGRTPINVTLPVGTNVLTVTNKALGLSTTRTVEVQPGQNPNRRLEFPRGRIEVRAPAGTRVAIDGRSVGKAPLAPVAVWPGGHLVEVVFPKGDKDSRRLTVEAGFNAAVEFEAPVHDSQLAQ